MEPFHSEHELLISWISSDNTKGGYDQMRWIIRYLNKKNRMWLPEGFSILSGTQEELISFFRSQLLYAEFRELMRQMRRAWHQHQYRQKQGKQVSFQLPESTVRDLNKIARYRDQSRTKTLIEVIHDATNHHQIERKHSRDRSKILRDSLEKISSDKLKSESLRNNVINHLSQRLAEEILKRLCYEEAINPLEDKEIEEFRNRLTPEYVVETVEAVENSIPDKSLLRSQVKKIADFLPPAFYPPLKVES